MKKILNRHWSEKKDEESISAKKCKELKIKFNFVSLEFLISAEKRTDLKKKLSKKKKKIEMNGKKFLDLIDRKTFNAIACMPE